MLEPRSRLASVAIFLIACCWVAGAEERSLLAQVCQPNKLSEAPIFTSPSQVRKLIEDQKTSQDGTCESHFNEAFSELGALLDPEQLKDICSLQMYNLIRSYHSKFVHFYLPESTREELVEARSNNKIGAPIPVALRNFFILFAKQIDASCKQHMVVTMQKGSLVSDADFAVLERYKEEKSRLDYMYELTKLGFGKHHRSKADDFNQLQIIDFLGARFADSTPQDGDKLYLQVRFNDRLKRIKDACEKRFMPVYMELFAPVIRLNNLGYIDRLKSTVEDRVLEEKKSIRRWFLIIQACEVLKDIEVLHDTSTMSALVSIIQDHSHLEAHNPQHQAQLRKVKILTPEEARQLLERSDKSNDDVRPSYDPDLLKVAHQPVAFTARMWLIQEEQVKSELEYFRKDIGDYVWQRTNKFKEWKDNAMMMIKQFYRKHKTQIVERDESSALGQLALFFERHRTALLIVALMLNIVLLSSRFFG